MKEKGRTSPQERKYYELGNADLFERTVANIAGQGNEDALRLARKASDKIGVHRHGTPDSIPTGLFQPSEHSAVVSDLEAMHKKRTKSRNGLVSSLITNGKLKAEHVNIDGTIKVDALRDTTYFTENSHLLDVLAEHRMGSRSKTYQEASRCGVDAQKAEIVDDTPDAEVIPITAGRKSKRNKRTVEKTRRILTPVSENSWLATGAAAAVAVVTAGVVESVVLHPEPAGAATQTAAERGASTGRQASAGTGESRGSSVARSQSGTETNSAPAAKTSRTETGAKKTAPATETAAPAPARRQSHAENRRVVTGNSEPAPAPAVTPRVSLPTDPAESHTAPAPEANSAASTGDSLDSARAGVDSARQQAMDAAAANGIQETDPRSVAVGEQLTAAYASIDAAEASNAGGGKDGAETTPDGGTPGTPGQPDINTPNPHEEADKLYEKDYDAYKEYCETHGISVKPPVSTTVKPDTTPTTVKDVPSPSTTKVPPTTKVTPTTSTTIPVEIVPPPPAPKPRATEIVHMPSPSRPKPVVHIQRETVVVPQPEATIPVAITRQRQPEALVRTGFDPEGASKLALTLMAAGVIFKRLGRKERSARRLRRRSA